MSFIQRIKTIHIEQEEWDRLLKMCSNWVELSDHISEITDERVILKMLRVEIETKKRATILSRLHGKYNRLRKDREMKEIWQELSA